LPFQQRPESPNMKSDKSSVLVESRVLSVLQEPSSELLLIREELSLDESSSIILRSWGYLVQDSTLAELSGEIGRGKLGAALERSEADLDLDVVFFPFIQEGMGLFFESEEIIMFLINRGALGEHL
jgi:hypothetical protein